MMAERIAEQLLNVVKETRREVNRLRGKNVNLRQAFIIWYLQTTVTSTLSSSKLCLVNDPFAPADAIHIDNALKTITSISVNLPSQYTGSKAPKLGPHIRFEQTAGWLLNKSIYTNRHGLIFEQCTRSTENLRTKCKQLLERKGYLLQLVFCSPEEPKKSYLAQTMQGRIDDHLGTSISVKLVGYAEMPIILQDYEDQVSPTISEVTLPIFGSKKGRDSDIMYQRDGKEGLECWVLPVNGRSVGDLFSNNGVRIFSRNVRGYMGTNSNVNRGIANTLANSPHMFMHFNNGVTILCDDANTCDLKKGTGINIQHPQIINGQQTTRSLAASDNSAKATVLVKIIKLARNLDKDKHYFHNVIGNIVKATNSQTPVTPSDLVSNDSRQLAVDKALRREGFIYLRKRETRAESIEKFGKGKSRRFINKVEVATAVASCEFDQKIVRAGREHLFEGTLYRKVFPNNKPYYYLLRYFLFKAVKKVSSENPNWSYARAIAISYIWNHLQKIVDKNMATRRTFVHACYNDTRSIQLSMRRIARATFPELGHFYKENRGEGSRAVDVSRFYLHGCDLNALFENHKWGKTNQDRFATGVVAIRTFLRVNPYYEKTIIDGI